MNPRARNLLSAVAFAATSLASAPGHAADLNGFPVCTEAGPQLSPTIVPDGSGGCIIAWHDQRPTVAAAGVCFAQRVNASGIPQWAGNGVALSTTGDLTDPTSPAIASDGAGGALVAFGGNNSQPRAQWVNAAGAPQWGADGAQLSTTLATRDLAIARDVNGAGGAIVVWRQDNGMGGISDIYAQKLNAAGAKQWGASGIAVTSTTMQGETLPVLISDGAGGAILAWFNGSGGVRAQRLNSSGVSQWGTTTLSSVSNNRRPSIVSDGSGGAVVAWGGSTGVFAQRVSALGDKLWNPANSGVQLSTTGNQCAMIGDGAGGATVTWQDNRVPTNFDIYAQRVTGAAGATQWTTNGVQVCQFQGAQLAPTIVSDGGTGAIITWYDGRTAFSGDDIYAQRIDGNGLSQWTANGIALCAATGDQQLPTIATDGTGGAFVTWQDLRGAANDIYVNHINVNGQVLAVPGQFQGPSVTRAWPNPFLDRVTLAFRLPAAARVRLEVFDVRGRSVRTYEPELLSAGDQALAWDGRASDGRAAGHGIYYLRATGAGIALHQRVVRLY